MKDIVFSYSQPSTTITIDASLTREGKLDICLMQMNANLDSIATDATRAASVNALRHFLVGGEGHVLITATN